MPRAGLLGLAIKALCIAKHSYPGGNACTYICMQQQCSSSWFFFKLHLYSPKVLHTPNVNQRSKILRRFRSSVYYGVPS